MLQVPPSGNGTFAAFIYFLFFGNVGEPFGALQSFLSSHGPTTSAAVRETQGGSSNSADAKQTKGGALGAAVERLLHPAGVPLWWFYVGLAILLSTIAIGVLALRRFLAPSA